MVSEDAPEGVGETAVGAAMMRARESARPDALFHDPYAAAFVAAAPPIFEEGPTVDDDPAIADLEVAFEEVVAVRTRFFDDFVTDAAGGGCRQVVLVGAGLDTRAFRLDLPQRTRVFELDLPEVLNFKHRVLEARHAEPRCERVTVAADLREHRWPNALIGAGFDPESAAAWVLEGVVPYLTGDEADRALADLTHLSYVGSRVALDHAGGGQDVVLRQAQSMESMEEITSMWQGGLEQGAGRWLAGHGWEAHTVHGDSLSGRYGRRGSPGAAGLHGSFVIANRLPA